jgi:predicted metalloprotease with PDZ domain/ketosteroid isomerase-like protein
MRKGLLTACVLLALPAWAQSQKAPILITADLTDAPRKLFHAEVDVPVTAGPLTLITPKWIPGTHQPYGPVSSITGVVFTANGQTLAWRRDDVDLYEFHVTIPKGVTTLHAHLDCIVGPNASRKLALLDWEMLMLYPANTPGRDIAIQPSLIVPAGWSVGTALTATGGGSYPLPAAGSTTHFAVTSVEQLEDSPVLAGQYFHEFALAPEISPKHFIDVASDAPEDSNLSPAFLAGIANLVREADALYRSHHYNQYHFLVALSDIVGAGDTTLEHGQSSEYGAGEKDFSDEGHVLANADLLPHEYTHSWDGKYRRPVGLYQPDFATAQQGALLWVYEGMTQYLGNMLAARSGLKSQAQYRDLLAWSAAVLDYTPGRQWRSTEDTAISASVLRGGNPAWFNWRRGQDYYAEGELVWLDADTLIRKMTNNQKSLDDFQRIFLGQGGNTGPLIITYTFDELVQDLNKVAPYDWATFLHERIDKINPRADVAGIERGGYKLVYADKPNPSAMTLQAALSSIPGTSVLPVDAWYSIGLSVGGDGSIRDVRWGGPADKAKISPGDKVIAVNGQIFSGDRLQAAIRDAKGKTEPIHLMIQTETFVSSADIDYHDGERYPVLERVEGSPAYLDDITKPLTATQSPANAADDQKSVAALDTQYQAAVKINDAATMDRILADDFILVEGDGKRSTKADLLKEAKSGRIIYEHQDTTAQEVRVWGDTAVVTAKLWGKGSDGGKAFNWTLWHSDTYVRTAKGWRYVFGQASLPLANSATAN